MHINTKNFLATKEIEWLLERFKKLSPAAKYKFITFFKTGIIMTIPIIINHNFLGYKFKWLYAKYAYGCNPLHHCTNAIKGRYSKVFSRLNPGFLPGRKIVMNEFPDIVWDAIYICGVASQGYTKHKNYPHNVHVAILPQEGATDHWEFENWKMDIQNGIFEYVPSEKEIDPQYLKLPEQYWTCRMFRWAVWHYHSSLQR